MAKIDLKKSKKITKAGAPIERTVKWSVVVTEQNIEELKLLEQNDLLQIDDQVELEGQVFIKQLNYKDGFNIAKSFDWNHDKDNPDNSTLKSVDFEHLNASRLVGTVCEDAEGTALFDTVHDVYSSDPKFVDAVYVLADQINNFLGKSRKKSLTEKNFSANSSSTELVEEPLKKQNKK